MPAAIKLMRMGKKGSPYYRIVAIDKRKNRSSNYLDKLGLYNPTRNPIELSLDEKKLDFWITRGAVLSEGIRKLLGKKIKKGLTSSDNQG